MNHTAIAAALRQIADALDKEQATPEAPAIAQPKLPKLPEGYNPHRHGDPCPINPSTWCHVIFTDGHMTEKDGGPIAQALCFEWPEVAGYKIVPSPEQQKEEPKPEWPWKPEEMQEYYASRANHAGDIAYFTWDNDGVDKGLFALGDVYRTCEEAQARAELNKRLAMTARLRQLGGGDKGNWAVRYDVVLREWRASADNLFAPGEARFLDKTSATAAIETLRAAGLLPESWQ